MTKISKASLNTNTKTILLILVVTLNLASITNTQGMNSTDAIAKQQIKEYNQTLYNGTLSSDNFPKGDGACLKLAQFNTSEGVGSFKFAIQSQESTKESSKELHLTLFATSSPKNTTLVVKPTCKSLQATSEASNLVYIQRKPKYGTGVQDLFGHLTNTGAPKQFSILVCTCSQETSFSSDPENLPLNINYSLTLQNILGRTHGGEEHDILIIISSIWVLSLMVGFYSAHKILSYYKSKNNVDPPLIVLSLLITYQILGLSLKLLQLLIFSINGVNIVGLNVFSKIWNTSSDMGLFLFIIVLTSGWGIPTSQSSSQVSNSSSDSLPSLSEFPTFQTLETNLNNISTGSAVNFLVGLSIFIIKSISTLIHCIIDVHLELYGNYTGLVGIIEIFCNLLMLIWFIFRVSYSPLKKNTKYKMFLSEIKSIGVFCFLIKPFVYVISLTFSERKQRDAILGVSMLSQILVSLILVLTFTDRAGVYQVVSIQDRQIQLEGATIY